MGKSVNDDTQRKRGNGGEIKKKNGQKQQRKKQGLLHRHLIMAVKKIVTNKSDLKSIWYNT